MAPEAGAGAGGGGHVERSALRSVPDPDLGTPFKEGARWFSAAGGLSPALAPLNGAGISHKGHDVMRGGGGLLSAGAEA